MQVNLPLTGLEQQFPDKEVLISETDVNGIIRSANAAFCRVSGYSEHELIGKSHNIIRHPDMPEAFFQDLWKTIKLGEQWTGVIKNRTAKGHFYWVDATVTPFYDEQNAEIIGFRSVRRKPALAQIKEAEQLLQRPGLVYDTLKARRKAMGYYSCWPITFRIWIPLLVSLLGMLGSFLLFKAGFAFEDVSLFAFCVALVSLLVAQWLSLRTKSSLRKITRAMQAFNAGDLNARIAFCANNEFGQIAKLFNRSTEMVETLIADVDQTTENLYKGDFSHCVHLTFPGDFDRVKQNINQTVLGHIEIFDALKISIERLSNGDMIGNTNQSVSGEYRDIFNFIAKIAESRRKLIINFVDNVDTIANGEFSARLSEENSQGVYKAFALEFNRLVQTMEAILTDIAQTTNELAEGNLSNEISKDYPGLFGETAKGVNALRQYIVDMLRAMDESVQVIHKASLQISNGNMDFAQRTEVQAVSLKKNAMSMEGLSQRVKQTADTARDANQLVLDTSALAIQGGEAVNEVINTMDAINQSALKVANIIGVIDEIAFQTNILALNAAVEAARAGEQGRGFAVVASEVRLLAQRSATAAKEIKDLIQDSVAKVEVGNDRVGYAGKTINEVVKSVNQVTGLIADITLASSVQSEGIDQVKDVIAQIDNITQMNNVLAAESIDAASILEKQSRRLSDMINNFSVEAGEIKKQHYDEAEDAALTLAPKFELF